MPRASYQYGTSPRKYEPDYTVRKTTRKNVETRRVPKKESAKKRIAKEKARKAEARQKQAKQIFVVLVVFGMLLSISYREISIMEMFNQKKDMQNQLALVEKENGQVEKNIKEVERTLDWNKIKQVAEEQLGMQVKTGTPVELDNTDNVEIERTFIEEEETSFVEKIINFIINR